MSAAPRTLASFLRKTLRIPDPNKPLLLPASDDEPEPVKWLWPGRIALGSITLLAGDRGTGKSLFARDLAARVSTTGPLVRCTKVRRRKRNPIQASRNCPVLAAVLPASVLILSASDQFHDTIVSRLAAAGADRQRVFVLDNITNLRTEMEKLRLAIDATPGLKLLIIDRSISTSAPATPIFKPSSARVLAPLAQLARQARMAILAIPTSAKTTAPRSSARLARWHSFRHRANDLDKHRRSTKTHCAATSSRLKNNLMAPTPRARCRDQSRPPPSPLATSGSPVASLYETAPITACDKHAFLPHWAANSSCFPANGVSLPCATKPSVFSNTPSPTDLARRTTSSTRPTPAASLAAPSNVPSTTSPATPPSAAGPPAGGGRPANS